MTPPQEVLSRRELFRTIFERAKQTAVIAPFVAAACNNSSGPVSTEAPNLTPTLPSRSPSIPRVTGPAATGTPFDARLSTQDFEKIASMAKGGFIDMIKTPHPISNGVEADLLGFDYDERQGIILARWRVSSWKILKDVQIINIKTGDPIKEQINSVDQAKGISLQGRAQIKWDWRQAPLTGRLDDVNNLQRGVWRDFRIGRETFSCQLGQAVSCRPATPTFKDNWPPYGVFFDMVFEDPVTAR